MALTVTADLTVITSAESITGWSAIGAQSPVLEPDFFVQGSNCISRAVSGAAVDKGMVFDNGSAIDFTSGSHKDKLVYIWMRCNTPQLVQTRANGGVKVRLCTGSATTNFREWYVDGSDTIAGTDGWICYVIDPQSAGSSTTGSYSAASVRYFGGSMVTTTTAKGQNFGIDQISYGRGEIYVSGTVSAAGQGFKEVADVIYDASGTNRFGIVQLRAGVVFVKGKIVIGHATSNTTFSSRGETVVFETPAYYNGTSVVKTIPDASVGGTAGADGNTTYNGVAFRGGSGATAIDFGVLVGSSGSRSGSVMTCPSNPALSTPGRTLATVAVDNSTMALSLYATSFTGFEGAVDLSGTGVVGDDCYGCTFNGCGRVASNMEIRNCNFLNSVAVATDAALIWSSTTDLEACVFANNSRAIVFESATGTPFTFTDFTFGGNTVDVRNESGGAITINIIGGTSPSFEDVGGGSSTTLVVNPVTVSVTALDATDGSPVENARVLVTAASGGALPFQESVTIARSGSVATVTHTAHGMVNSDKVQIKGAAQPQYNGVFTITLIDANSYSFVVAGSPATPATGTPQATFVAIEGLTNASGFISASRSYGASSAVVGKVRRGSSSPLYKNGPLAGTISNATGLAMTSQMVPDD